jgi:type II secretory pathway pseudopilin PulG
MPKLVCGFTLVETLVAISILMLSVTGPLYYASESLKAATYAKDQITAFYLAQDAFEQIRKIRDDNVYGDGSLGWNIGLNGCEATSCRVAPNEGSFYTIENTNSPSTDYYSLFLNPISGVYSHDSSNTKTIFGREILIEPMDATDPSLDLWEGATEMKVTVKIKWNSRGTPREFTAYEFLRALNTL